MADLKINIVTKYDQAEKGFNKVSGSLQKYRKELIEASKSGHVSDEQIQNYVDALNRCLTAQDLTKEGMAALNAQARLLKGEMGQIGLTFGEQGELFKKMSASLQDVKAQMKDVGNTSNNTSLKLLSVAKNILKFQLLMGPITAAVRGFRNTLSDSVKVAAEAEQVFNKLATVFDTVADSADRMATELAASIGVAKSTAASALSTVGDLLQAQGMGSGQSLSTASEWVKQFQDIIAFKDINMSLEEFAQNFMSGAAGNLRNFRTFGSIVKESAVQTELMRKGQDKLTGSELELAKMTTRAEMALAQQKNAMGATTREWNTALSVNRRLNEQWKIFKENLGDTINQTLIPMRKWWTEILDQINKANKSTKEVLADTNAVSKAYNITENERDMKKFTNVVNASASGVNLRNVSAIDENNVRLMQTINALNTDLRIFDASVSDLEKVLGDRLSGAVYDYLRNLEKERNALNAEREARLKIIEAMNMETENLTSTFDNYLESLKLISGVGNITIPDGNTERVHLSLAKQLAKDTQTAAVQAFNNIKSADLTEFASAVDLALGKVEDSDLLKGKAESLASLYEILFNKFTKDGTLEKNATLMQQIADEYKSISVSLESSAKILDREKAILAGRSSMGSVLSSISRLQYENNLSGPQSSQDYNMALTWDIPLQIEAYAKALKDAGVALEEVRTETNAYRNALLKEASVKYQIAAKAERDELLNGYATSAEDYRQQRMNLGLSDAEITRNKLMADYNQAVADEDNELITAISKTILEFDKLQESTAQLALVQKINPFSGVTESYNLGQSALGGGVMAGIAGVLADIAANTEAFQKLASIVTDHIVPVLDAFLEPILPVIDVIGDLMQSLIQGILVPLFPIIVEICALVTLVVGTIKNIADLIVNTIKKVIGSLAYNIMRALDKLIIGDQSHWYEGTWMDQWSRLTPWETFKSAESQLLEEVKNIRGLTFDIKENTDDKDLLATLKELYSRGIIDEQQFYVGARVKQKDMIFDPVSPSSDHYITYGSITINVNGGDIEETKRVIAEIFNENGISYNMALGRY